MKTNEELQKDVLEAINWEPLLNAAEIGIIVKDGVVTLTGLVDSYAKKEEAENAAKSVTGVKVVVEKIDVKSDKNFDKKTDYEIAEDLIKAVKWNSQIPKEKIRAQVEDGWVTLEGEVVWNYQREAAFDIAKYQDGVKGVTNNITIMLNRDQVEKEDIERAFRRNLLLDDTNISVNVKDNIVTLNGVVPSWMQKEKAEKIAWKARGIQDINNQLKVEYNY
jgi:osmotically-inducible protein OsmY